MTDCGPLGWCYYCLIERDERTPATVMVHGSGCCERDAREVAEHEAKAADEQEDRINAIQERVQAMRPGGRPGR
jgi:hypothetical protein